jgi:hypothetical protein
MSAFAIKRVTFIPKMEIASAGIIGWEKAKP